MNLVYTNELEKINWRQLRQDLIADDFHNGRSVAQLRRSFEQSQISVCVLDEAHCVGTARALSDGVCNCYVVDVWTQTAYRNHGIATEMMNSIINQVPGQHLYLQTEDAVAFYEKLGFRRQPEGLAMVSGTWLNNF